MHDSDLPPPTVAFFARVVGAFVVIYIAAVVFLHCSGCAHAPPPIVLAIDASNAVADELTALVAANDRTIRAEAVRGERACVVTDRACRQVAIQAALSAHTPETAKLMELGLIQHLMADSLDVAKKCKAANDDACLLTSLEDAGRLVSELRAGVAAYRQEHSK